MDQDLVEVRDGGEPAYRPPVRFGEQDQLRVGHVHQRHQHGSHRLARVGHESGQVLQRAVLQQGDDGNFVVEIVHLRTADGESLALAHSLRKTDDALDAGVIRVRIDGIGQAVVVAFVDLKRSKNPP